MNLKGLQFLSLLWIGSLFALTGLRQFFVEPLANPIPNVIWFTIQVLPLLIVVPGLLRLRIRSVFLATLAAMLYFFHGVLQSVAPEDRLLGLWEVGFSLALVLTASLAVRHMRMAQAELKTQPKDSANPVGEPDSSEQQRDKED